MDNAVKIIDSITKLLNALASVVTVAGFRGPAVLNKYESTSFTETFLKGRCFFA